MMKKTPIVVVFVLFLIFMGLALTGCKKKDDAPKARDEKTVKVRTKAVSTGKFRPYIEAVGTLKPYEEVIISAEVGGILKGLEVDAGTPLKAGMTLGRIEDADYVLEASRAEAALRQAEAALTNTRAELKRKEALYGEALVTEQQMEDLRMRLSLAEAQAASAQNGLELARLRLQKTVLKSPISGVVREKSVTRGDLVKPGVPLLSIIGINPIKLLFGVPERDLGSVRKGQEAVFTVDSFPGREFRAKVGKLHPALDEKTRTLQVEAESPNQAGALRPGLFVRVKLYTGAEKEALIVPWTSVLYEGEKTKLFIAEGGAAKERFVKTGQKLKSGEEEFIEIADGVKKGEIVVTVGQQMLFDGAKLIIEE